MKQIDKSPSNDASLDSSITTTQKQKRMKFWQTVVIITLFITYGFNYFTRNHIYVTTDQFRDYLDPTNGQKYLGIMYTVGQIGFFISKLFCSFLIDTKINSGVKPFAFGLIGVPICTTIIALTTLFNIQNNTFRILFIMLMWTLTMACQAPQWSGVIKIISDWIDYKYYGRVVSFMSLSYLAGDAITRAIFAYVLTINKMNNWQNIFYFASIMTIIAVIPLLILVKDSPIKRGLDKPIPNPDNVYSKQNLDIYFSAKDLEKEHNSDIVNELKLATKSHSKLAQSKSWILLKPLLPQMMFYFIILFNVYLSILRTFFQMYAADYLSTQVGTTDSTAALISSLFPAMGVISAPLNGIWIDIMLNKNKSVLRYILFPIQGVIFTVPIVIIWYDENFYGNGNLTQTIAVVLILMCGFGICGCYAMLYVLSLDLGGDKSPTIVSGITDCAGLIGSMAMSFLSGFFNYAWLFGFLSIIGITFIITSICLVVYAYCKS